MSVFVFMVRTFVVTGLIFSLSCLPAQGWEGYVTKVLDGDSLGVKKGRRVHEIRLYGIDSPEYGQLFWQEARGLTRELILGEIVNVKPMDTDHYGRIVALVWHQGQLVNSELVRTGLAWVYPRYCQKQPLCSDMKKMEEAAQKQKRGLWREKSPVAPWLWKRLKN